MLTLYMRKDVEREGDLLDTVYLTGQIFTKRRVQSQE